MKEITITRSQFEKLKEIFDTNNDVDHIVWREESTSGIGPNVTIELGSKSSVKIDNTDLESW